MNPVIKEATKTLISESFSAADKTHAFKSLGSSMSNGIFNFITAHRADAFKNGAITAFLISTGVNGVCLLYSRHNTKKKIIKAEEIIKAQYESKLTENTCDDISTDSENSPVLQN